MVRERAAQHGIALELERRAGPRRRDRGRRAASSSRWSSTCSPTPSSSRPTAARSWSRARRRGRRRVVIASRDTGIGIAAAGPRAHLRGLPAGRRGARPSAGGHRPRPDARRAGSSSCTAAGSGSRARSASAAPSPSRFPRRRHRGRRRRAVDERRAGRDATRPRSSSSRTTPAPPTCCRSTSSAPGFAVAVAARRRGGPARSPARLRPAAVHPRHPAAAAGRLGRPRARSRPTRDWPTIPVVVVSMLDERGKGFALGAADYLVKPVGREELLAALRRCMARPPDARRTVVVIDDDPIGARAGRGRRWSPQGWPRAARRRAASTASSSVAARAPAVVLARPADARARRVRGRRAAAGGPRDRATSRSSC